jgi:hypothetical protein
VPIDPGQAYYYAGGERRGLGDSDLVAVDLDAVGDLEKEVLQELRGTGRPLTGAVVLVDAATARRLLGDRLEEAPGVHPVYEAEGALVVVLPEVRVEGGVEALRRVQERSSARAGVDASEGRLVLRPRSRRGQEALELANELTESAEEDELDLAQPRFLRITERPDTQR